MIENTDEFNVFCDTLALIYHESRNVRHLIRAGLLNSEPWRFVVSLSTNRDEAWREIAPLRDKARRTLSVEGALDVFTTRFHVSLRDLSEMFANTNWRHAKLYGGNAWTEITKLTLQLAEALQSKNRNVVYQIANQLKRARHNTGSLQEKIARLEKIRENRSA